MTTRIDIREEDKEVYPVEVVYGSEGDILRIMSERDMAISIIECDGTVIQVYNEEIDKLIEALQEIKKYIPSSDMSDPDNWRVGDIVECVDDDYADSLSLSDTYTLLENLDEDGDIRIDLDGDEGWYIPATAFKLHSRKELPDY